MSEYTTVGYEFDWDGEIKNENSFTLLPEGKYPFVVKSVERAHYDGSAKIPSCKMVLLEVEVDGGSNGKTTITERMYLHSIMEGKLCSFFTSIGKRKHGEAFRMDWQGSVGCRGLCKLEINEYTGKDGTTKKNNRIKSFLEPEKPEPAPVQQTWANGKF